MSKEKDFITPFHRAEPEKTVQELTAKVLVPSPDGRGLRIDWAKVWHELFGDDARSAIWFAGSSAGVTAGGGWPLNDQIAAVTTPHRPVPPLFGDQRENPAVGVYWIGQDGLIQQVNQAQLDLLGYERDEFVGRPIASFHANPEAIEDIIDRLKKGEAPCDYEARLRCKEGSIKHAFVSLHVLREDGQLIHTRCSTVDITPLRLVHKMLVQSTAFYSSLAESVPQNLFLKDVLGRYIFGNQRFCAMLERPLADIIGRTDFDFYPAPLAEKYRLDDLDLMRTGRVIEEVEEYVTPQGEKRYVHAIKTLVLDNGEVIGTQGLFWDVTREKRVEDERRRIEAEPQRLFELSLDLLCIAGFDGRFKVLNPAWEHTLGFRREELLARPYLGFVHPDDREATLAVAQAVKGGARVVAFENRYLCKDGSYRWFLWNVVPFAEGEMLYAMARDITERKQGNSGLEIH